MKIEDDTVVFKSESYYFKLERDGLKPNTVRLLTHAEKQQIRPKLKTILPEITETVVIKKIRIECTAKYEIKTHDASPDTFPKLEPFTRTLTSIEQIGELCGFYLFVFSWRHEEEEAEQ